MTRVPSPWIRPSLLLIILVLLQGCATLENRRMEPGDLLDYCGNIACNSKNYLRWTEELRNQEDPVDVTFFSAASLITKGGSLPPVAMGAIDSAGIVGLVARSLLSPEAEAFLRETNIAVFADVKPVFVGLISGHELPEFAGLRGEALDCRLLAHEQSRVERQLDELKPNRAEIASEISALFSRGITRLGLPKSMRATLKEEMGGQFEFDDRCTRRRFGMALMARMREPEGAETGTPQIDPCTCEPIESSKQGFHNVRDRPD